MENFPFDPTSSNQVHVVLLNSDDYEADELSLTSTGVILVRTGTDINFFPYNNIAKIYQSL